jgi:hypothetical protein
LNFSKDNEDTKLKSQAVKEAQNIASGTNTTNVLAGIRQNVKDVDVKDYFDSSAITVLTS